MHGNESSKLIELELRTREGGQPIQKVRSVAADEIGVVVIDMWNHHWCNTACNRVGAMVPRMNDTFETARALGLKIFWAPTGAVGGYSGTIPREKAAAVKRHDAIKLREFHLAKSSGGLPVHCMCGSGIQCKRNYGWDSMHPDLIVREDDYVVCGAEELFSLCKENNVTTLIYAGVHANACVLGKPAAIRSLYELGIDCLVARDLVDAFTDPNSVENILHEAGTANIVADIERLNVPSINMGELMQNQNSAEAKSLTEFVRMAPWGVKERPYSFRGESAVVLSSPWLKNAEFFYTLDGSEPSPHSMRYDQPIVLSDTVELKAVAYRNGKPVSLISEGYYVSLSETPSVPDIHLSEVEREIKGRAVFNYEVINDLSFSGTPLTLRSDVYERGIGMRSPTSAYYPLKPEYKRFVASVGIDDRFLFEETEISPSERGRRVAMYPSLRFLVLIDGVEHASSPIMRVGSAPWGFDVEIPLGSRQITLSVISTGTPYPLEYGDWVNAGFIIQ